MDPVNNLYHLIITITLCSLLIAVGISVFFSAEHSSKDNQATQPPAKTDETIPDQDTRETYIIRILWFDDQNKTYSFQDYPSDTRPDPQTYAVTGVPPVPGAQAAMIRFLSWDGKTEKTTGARYLLDQDTVTSILNRYSLTSSVTPEPTPVPTAIPTPVPLETPKPGTVIPELGGVCIADKGLFVASFGYTSRNDKPVLIPIGEKNRFSPGEEDRGQPDIFQPGIHHDLFSITYSPDSTNQVWTLMDQQVSAGTVKPVTTKITVEPVSGYAPLEVRFSALSTGGTATDPLSSYWDIDNGTRISDTGQFSHRYENAGTYRVTHTVRNRCSDADDTVLVHVYRASFRWVAEPASPQTVRFSDTSGGEPDLWFWDFADGNTSWEQNPVHTYPGIGRYQVGLTISGKNGRGSVVQSIDVPVNAS
ncbi:MAG: PKD domain-containing protein [Methanospirillum sp.]|nr:PKD domain-containing protein [Methanospirillum sp.]